MSTRHIVFPTAPTGNDPDRRRCWLCTRLSTTAQYRKNGNKNPIISLFLVRSRQPGNGANLFMEILVYINVLHYICSVFVKTTASARRILRHLSITVI